MKKKSAVLWSILIITFIFVFFSLNYANACSCASPVTDYWEIIVKGIKIDGQTVYLRSEELEPLKMLYQKNADICTRSRSYYAEECQKSKRVYFSKKLELSSLLPKEFTSFSNCELSAGDSHQNFIRCLTNVEFHIASLIGVFTKSREDPTKKEFLELFPKPKEGRPNKIYLDPLPRCVCSSDSQLIIEGSYEIARVYADFEKYSKGSLKIESNQIKLLSSLSSGKEVEVVFEIIAKHQGQGNLTLYQ